MMYGHKWTSQYGDHDADHTWSLGLRGLSSAQLGFGLGMCLKMSRHRVQFGEEDWPPTLGQFRAWCLQKSSPPLKQPLLPYKALSGEDRARALEACRAALRGELQ